MGSTHTSNTISMTISPADASVVSGGSLQFSAIVGGASQSDVTWSTSAGRISSNGLFTAPVVAAGTSLEITATSVAAHQNQAFALVQVTVTPLTITLTSLPGASVGTNYAVTLGATGGKTPYLWDIVGGSLSPGLELNAATGTINGTPRVLGTFPFEAVVTDKKGAIARQSFDLQVTSFSACGPPNYPCSRSDFGIVIPAAPPQLGSNPAYYGGPSGAGVIGIDPSYGNRILRVTDANTEAASPGMSFGTSWSAEANLISSDESLFFATNEGNIPCLFEFEPVSFEARFHGCRYHNGAGNLQFGYTPADANAFYNYAGHFLYRFLVDRSTFGISRDQGFNQGHGYFDPDGPQCLNGQLAAEKRQWYVQDTSLSSDDSTFVAMMGPEQDVDPYVVVWNASKGCRWLNVKTWEVSQGWNTGLANPVKISWVSGTAPTLPGGMHNVQLDRSGQYAVLTINGTSLSTKVFWDIDTSVVNDTCAQCWSHWACDFGVCFWSFGSGQGATMRDLAIFPLTDMHSQPGHRDLPVTASKPGWGTDEHAAHQNASSDRKNIYLLENSRDVGAFTVDSLWDNEIIGVNWDGSKRTIRFNKTWASGYGGCLISHLGNYAICSSDYQMYNRDRGFGSGLNQDTCDHRIAFGGRGTRACRSDVLLFELR